MGEYIVDRGWQQGYKDHSSPNCMSFGGFVRNYALMFDVRMHSLVAFDAWNDAAQCGYDVAAAPKQTDCGPSCP